MASLVDQWGKPLPGALELLTQLHLAHARKALPMLFEQTEKFYAMIGGHTLYLPDGTVHWFSGRKAEMAPMRSARIPLNIKPGKVIDK